MYVGQNLVIARNAAVPSSVFGVVPLERIPMLKLKVLGAAALLAVAPVLMSTTAADAQFRGRGGPGFRAAVGGGNFNAGRAFASPRWGGGGARVGGWNGGGRRWAGAGIGLAAGLAAGAAIASRPYYGGYGYGYGYNPNYYYGSQTYYNYDEPTYADPGYVDAEPQVVGPGQAAANSVEYCRQTYRSYDVRSGTYLGYDGNRYSCP